MGKSAVTIDIQNTLQALDLFKSCSSSFWNTVKQYGYSSRIEKGRVLFLNDETAERIYVIKSGWVRLYRETLDGAQATIDLVGNSSCFGETSLFNDDRHTYSAESAEDCELISLPFSLIKNELFSNQNFVLSILSAIAKQSLQQTREIEHRTLQTAPQRIGCFILRMVDAEQKNDLTIHLPYDKSLIASRLGMQPETFSRALKKLKDETGIAIKGAVIEIESLDTLSSFTCAGCSLEFPCPDLKRKNR